MSLTTTEADYARALVAKGMRQRAVGSVVGVSQQAISKIARGEHHVEFDADGRRYSYLDFRAVPWQWQPYFPYPRHARTIPGLTMEERQALIEIVGGVELSTISLTDCHANGVKIPRIVNGRVVR